MNNILYIQRILNFYILLDLHFLLCTLSIPITFIQINQRKFHELEISSPVGLETRSVTGETFVHCSEAYIEKKGALT